MLESTHGIFLLNEYHHPLASLYLIRRCRQVGVCLLDILMFCDRNGWGDSCLWNAGFACNNGMLNFKLVANLQVGDVCITIRHIDKGEERACCSSEGAAGPSSQQISQPAERMDPARGSRVGRDDSGGGWRSAPPYRPPIDPSAIPPEPTRQRRKSST